MPSLEDLTTDQLLAYAKNAQGAVDIVSELGRNQETRSSFQKLIKQVRPDAPIPELDAEAKLEKRLAEEASKREALEQKLLEREARESVEAQRKKIMEKYHFSESDMAEVYKLVTHEDPEQRIPTLPGAAAVYHASKQNSTPTPASLTPRTFEMPDASEWQGGIGNRAQLDKIAIKAAYEAANEFRSGKVLG
jgi:hypothetical protein